jgi:hypothetical protein
VKPLSSIGRLIYAGTEFSGTLTIFRKRSQRWL